MKEPRKIENEAKRRRDDSFNSKYKKFERDIAILRDSMNNVHLYLDKIFEIEK
ncbi:MAG: hypothetical protein HRS57_02465 [Mycoplasmataceae bacterium]|nr:hypothetical protein [Mycoplasmataceae bacterium]